MAQFRTTKDILTEVLQKSGEPTNGNSPYQDIALTYLNKAHQVLVGGGSIFSINVDEAWTWAKAKNPIVLELQPGITYGQLSVTYGDVNATLTDAPAGSVQGWYLQIVGTRTVYRVVQHEAGQGTVILDSTMLTESGNYNYRLFKLDYEVFPAFLYIDQKNDRLDFEETSDTPLQVTLSHGSYTPTTLINHVAARMNALATGVTYSGQYDSVLKQTTLSGSADFSLLGGSGSSRRRSVLPTLGMDLIDHPAAQAHESTYIINAVSRLIEPFRVFTMDPAQPFIESVDPIEMERDHKLNMTDERVPTLFARMDETNEGNIIVRFNAYPAQKTKVTIDWVPVPIDLQDNDASYPLIPRRDIDTLIHAASAFILFDKEDSKWEAMLQLAGGQLEAMQKKNRSELFRTGKDFAQIVPRQDLAQRPRKLRYGYTVEGGARPAAVNETAQKMIKVTKSYSEFSEPALTHTVTARILPGNRTLFALIAKHTIPFSGGDITGVTLSVGVPGELDKFISNFDLTQPVSDSAQTSVLTLFYPAVETPIQVTLTATGANLNELTQGSLDLYFQETIVEL